MLRKKSFLLVFLVLILLNTYSAVFAASNLVARNFTVTDMAGKKHALSQYKGKWVIVNYWATWCPPCLEEVPDFVALYDSRKNKDVMTIGVAFDYQNAKEVAEYVDDMLMSYPIVLGDDHIAGQIGYSDVLPTTFIYNPLGELVKTKHGKVTKQYLEGIIASESKK
jgi:thiol-disulfide isomerase/thioredoxin